MSLSERDSSGNNDSKSPEGHSESSSSSRPDLAWAAGFVDGEGCIYSTWQRYKTKRRPTFRLGLNVSQNDLETLECLRTRLGVDVPIHKVALAKNHKRQCYTLNYSGQSAVHVLAKLLPNLVRKKREALSALACWTEGRMGQHSCGKPLAPELVAIRQHYFELLKSLK